jgi:hypothetical protein
MSAYDDAKRLRIRGSVLAEESLRSPSSESWGAPSLVAQTISLGSYPATAASFYACCPRTVFGPEIEGGAGTLSTQAGRFFALNLGSTIPPTGTDLLVTFVGNRWVFRYDK